MRIVEDRYEGELQSFQLALRFVLREARTRTIRLYTGLSDHRIRKLWRRYCGGARGLTRHRGKSPHQARYFIRSVRVRMEASVLAAAYCAYGLVREDQAPGQPQSQPGLAQGMLLSEIYDYYAVVAQTPAVSFEHAVFLSECLREGGEIVVRRCGRCHGHMVVERLPVRDRCCDHCAAHRGPAQHPGG
jgi:hypothetical protein